MYIQQLVRSQLLEYQGHRLKTSDCSTFTCTCIIGYTNQWFQRPSRQYLDECLTQPSGRLKKCSSSLTWPEMPWHSPFEPHTAPPCHEWLQHWTGKTPHHTHTCSIKLSATIACEVQQIIDSDINDLKVCIIIFPILRLIVPHNQSDV